MSRLSKRLTYANVMSTVAVFLAIGGASAFAAVQLGRETVGPAQLKQNAVRTGKIAPEAVRAGRLGKEAVVSNRIRRNAVTPGKLAPEAVRAGRLAKNSIATDRLREGSVTGPKIARGAVAAEQLADGAVSASKLGPVNVRPTSIGVAPNSTGQVSSQCPAGERLIAVGAHWSPVASGDHSIESLFAAAANTAVARGKNSTPTPAVLTVQAFCLGA